MSGETVHRALVGTLGIQLGAGGQGQVLLAPEISLPDVPGPLVYKEYLPSHGLAAVDARRLRMDEATRSRMDRAAVWPVRLVEDGGQVSGVLMRLIPDEFFQERTKPSGAPTRTLPEVRLVDCDAVRIKGSMPVARQLNARTGIRRRTSSARLRISVAVPRLEA